MKFGKFIEEYEVPQTTSVVELIRELTAEAREEVQKIEMLNPYFMVFRININRRTSTTRPRSHLVYYCTDLRRQTKLVVIENFTPLNIDTRRFYYKNIRPFVNNLILDKNSKTRLIAARFHDYLGHDIKVDAEVIRAQDAHIRNNEIFNWPPANEYIIDVIPIHRSLIFLNTAKPHCVENGFSLITPIERLIFVSFGSFGNSYLVTPFWSPWALYGCAPPSDMSLGEIIKVFARRIDPTPDVLTLLRKNTTYEYKLAWQLGQCGQV